MGDFSQASGGGPLGWGGDDFELSPEEKQEVATGSTGGKKARPRAACAKALKLEEAWKQ